MPRVTHVNKARKDNPAVKKGEPYYWWKFRYGGKRYSRTMPKQSQLTQSAYLGTVYSIMEEVEGWSGSDIDDFESFQEDVVSQLQDLQGETQDSLDNMPESLQYSPTGELLQERIDGLDSAESEVECIDGFYFETEDFEAEDFDEEGYEDEEEMEDARADHESEQEELEREHEEAEATKEQDEFNDWLSNAKEEMSGAIEAAVI